MERIQFIEHNGKKILLEDFSNLKPNQEFLQNLDNAKEVIHSQPPKSVLALFDATECTFNNQILDAMKEFTKSNTPYIKCAATVGITGMLRIALTAISKVAGREFHTFDDRKSALDFLAKQ
ncbi:MAG TPA: hypothetical protein VIO61_10830 [Anaerolineaceae bacterium]